MQKPCYWVYILLCDNNCFYTGYTNDLTKRYESHRNGTASKYTRSFKPRKIAQFWEIGDDKSVALRMESYIKRLSRVEKEKVITHPALLYEKYGLAPTQQQHDRL
jgi:putative endonuclease